jgi:hypothetical protein
MPDHGKTKGATLPLNRHYPEIAGRINSFLFLVQTVFVGSAEDGLGCESLFAPAGIAWMAFLTACPKLSKGTSKSGHSRGFASIESYAALTGRSGLQ